jgi:hypothetical protein
MDMMKLIRKVIMIEGTKVVLGFYLRIYIFVNFKENFFFFVFQTFFCLFLFEKTHQNAAIPNNTIAYLNYP